MPIRERLLAATGLRATRDGALLWRRAEHLGDAAALVAAWLQGDLRYLPWGPSKPTKDLAPDPLLVRALVRACGLDLLPVEVVLGRGERYETVTLVVDGRGDR